MTLETAKKIALLMQHVASKDETRHHLGAVKVTKTEVLACDGHILARLDHEDDSITEDAYYHRDDMAIVKAHIKAMRPGKIVGVTMTDYCDYKKSYPNLDTLMPKDKTPRFATSFNPELLHKLVKGMGWKRGTVLLQFDDPGSPIRVSASDCKGKGVLMPMRMSESKETKALDLIREYLAAHEVLYASRSSAMDKQAAAEAKVIDLRAKMRRLL